MNVSKFFVVLAPDLYGDSGTRVVSSHKTLDAARRSAKMGPDSVVWFVVRQGNKKKGQEFLRVYESVYPIVGGDRP